ncbi:MAG: lactonase family protein [Planctomycetota bacterium]
MRIAVGSYTDGTEVVEGTDSTGVGTASFDPDTGALAPLHAVPDTEQNSWVEPSLDGARLYANGELHDVPGQVIDFALDPDAKPTLINRRDAEGKDPCHIATVGDRLFCANYNSGSTSVFNLSDAGIGEPIAVYQYEGSGPNKGRQRGPHAHQTLISPDNRWLYVCDLGSDRVHVHDLADRAAPLVHSVPIDAGAGPRHMAFHTTQPIAYVWCELRPLVIEFDWDAATGELTNPRAHDLDADFGMTGANAGAAVWVHPSGDVVAVSERAQGTIALLSLTDGHVDGRTLRLETGIKTPRDFRFSPQGDWLLIACQDTHRIASHRLADPMSPEPQPASTIPWRKPVCIPFLVEP